MAKSFIVKGNIIFSKSPEELSVNEGSYLVCENGKSAGVFKELPERYANLPMDDFGERLIISGLCDLHLHACQYAFRGTGMDLELLDWLNTQAFPEEARYENLEYAERAYDMFVQELLSGPTTSAVIFATLHRQASLILMEKLEKSGLRSLVGKVNMDRNSPSYLIEETAASLSETEEWIKESARFKKTGPIITPRFTPSCSDTLMEGLGKLQKKYGLPVQSHLSENLDEVEWVKKLCPDCEDYGETYERFGLFGDKSKTVMAHCVYSSESEVARMKRRGVYIAHCPQSNTNLTSGIAPARLYLKEGLNIGLGTDLAGGANTCLFRTMASAVQVSKLRWRLVDKSLPPLSFPEVFYMASLGGGSFFGKVGSFDKDYIFDAVVLDDSGICSPRPMSLSQRLERLMYLGCDGLVTGKYVDGIRLF
ncbi:MAG: amidohydrolase family protein [Clostridiales bacterium]|jgi:guanine deaminase|nr:amidohydrolase family protein [Clostridiales bacterium]